MILAPLTSSVCDVVFQPFWISGRSEQESLRDTSAAKRGAAVTRRESHYCTALLWEELTELLCVDTQLFAVGLPLPRSSPAPYTTRGTRGHGQQPNLQAASSGQREEAAEGNRGSLKPPQPQPSKGEGVCWGKQGGVGSGHTKRPGNTSSGCPQMPMAVVRGFRPGLPSPVPRTVPMAEHDHVYCSTPGSVFRSPTDDLCCSLSPIVLTGTVSSGEEACQGMMGRGRDRQ